MKAGPRVLKKTRKPSPLSASISAPPYDESKEPTPWTSLEDLKRPEARKLLREQLTGNDSEIATQSTMPFRNRSAKRADLKQVAEVGEAISSTSSVDSSGLKKLAEKAEKDITTVDVEQAVTLLEELKKVATPEQLVSLHKALLPTKEVETVPNPANKEEYLTSRLTRQRSNLPPGLATRGGASNDLLRKPASTSKLDTPRRKDAGDDSWISPMSSIDTISNPKPRGSVSNPDILRAATPSDEYLQAGVYGHGTLRITNGYASPDPSIYGDRDNFETHDTKIDEGYLTSPEGPPSIDENRASGPVESSTPRPDQAFQDADGRSSFVESKDMSHATLGDPTPVEPLRIRERAWSSSALPKAISDRDFQGRQSRDISPVSSISFTEFQQMTPTVVISPVVSPELENALSTLRNNNDSTGPMLRYQQRWSQRMTDVSRLSLSRSNPSLDSPEFRDSPLLNFRSRLSTVEDDEHEGGDDDFNPPLKHTLPAVPSTTRHNEGPHTASKKDDEDSLDPTLQKSYKEVMVELEIRTRSKHDSGYSSDELSEPSEYNQRSDKIDCRSETSTLADGRSVYNLQEFLHAPPQSRQSHKPLPAAPMAKNNSPFMRLSNQTEEKESSPTGTLPFDSKSPISPVSPSTLTARIHNKLQKPNPAGSKPRLQSDLEARSQKARVDLQVPRGSRDTSGGRSRAMSSPVDQLHAVSPPESLFPTPDEMKGDSYFPAVKLKHSMAEKSSQRPVLLPDTPSAILAQRIRPRAKTAVLPEIPTIVTPLKSVKPEKTGLMGHLRNISGGRWGKKEVPTPDEDEVPEYMDIGSVAQTLGSGSYDIASQHMKSTTKKIPPKEDRQMQSPHYVGNPTSRQKTFQGMSEASAAEYARSRSRDIGGKSMNPTDERPHIAIPKRRAEVNNIPSHSVSVEDRFPDWRSKPSPPISREEPPMEYGRPNSMHAETVPSMPDLAADAQAMTLQVDQMLAERRQINGRGLPPLPPPHGYNQLMEQSERFALEKRPQTSPAQDPDRLCVTNEAERAQRWKEWRLSLGFNDPLEDEDEFPASPDARPGLIRTQTEPSPAIVVSRYITPIGSANARPTDSAAQHADVYRDLIGEDEVSTRPQQVPPRADSANSFASSASAAQQTYMPYRPQPQPHRQPPIPYKGKDWQIAAGAIPRAPSPGGRVWTENGSWVPFSPVHTTMPERSRATSLTQQHPVQRHSAKSLANSGYDDTSMRSARPSHGRAESSVASFGGNNKAFPSPTKMSDRSSPTRSYFDGHSTSSTSINAPRQRPSFERSSVINSFVSYDSRASTPNSLNTPGVSQQHARGSSDSLFDRFSGGLSYGWDKEKGFGGSAGTRSKHEEFNKELPMTQSFGLDLSDVPVFLRKTNPGVKM